MGASSIYCVRRVRGIYCFKGSMAYRGKEENPLYSEAMDLIVTANWELYKESEKMCNEIGRAHV